MKDLDHFKSVGWRISRYAEVASILADSRCVPTIIGLPAGNTSPERRGDVRERHGRMKDALAEIIPVLEQQMPMLLATAADRVGLNQPFDLIQELLKPWCLQVAACAVAIQPERNFGILADTIFAASAFPYDAELGTAASSAAAELATHIDAQHPIALQAFIALATSLPAFIGNAMALLFSHPDQLRRLRNEPLLAPLAIEECLRLGGPSSVQFRRASCDMDIGAAQIRREDILLLMIESANRDPGVFLHPETFDIQRINNPHLAFGRGGHSCVGANLIRSISRQLISKILSLFTTVELIEPPAWNGTAMRFVDRLQVVLGRGTTVTQRAP